MTSELYPLKHIDNFATRYGWKLFTKTSRYRSFGGSLSYSRPIEFDEPSNFFGNELKRWLRDLFGNEHYVIFNEIIDFIHGDNDIVTSC